MKSSNFSYKDQDGIEIFVYKWEPDSGKPKAILQISHGVAEHALRYQYFAEYLTRQGISCYADDHRGHGKSMIEGQRGHLGPNGWVGAISSIHELTKIIKKENPNIPVFFFGHSLGSFFGQDIIQRWGSDYKGAILSGTLGHASKINVIVGGYLSRRAAKKSPLQPNTQLHNMIMKPLNKRWAKEKGATGSEWISSDNQQVQKYVNDPLCAFVEPSSYFADLSFGTQHIWRKANEQKIPKELPIYFIAGELDPVGFETKSVTKLMKRYQGYGIKDIEHKYYKNGRHESINEVFKEEVYNDVATWVLKHVS